MAKENNYSENSTQPVSVAVKKDNTLPIIAVALAGSALLVSLFTAGTGVASATPEHRPDREHSQVMEHEGKNMNEGNQYKMEKHEGMPEQERKMNKEHDMSQMGEKQYQERMGQSDMVPNTMTGAS